MPNWLLAVALVIQAHFSASYLVPLDPKDPNLSSGPLALLPWLWPWSQSDAGFLGQTLPAASGTVGFFIAMGAAGLSILAALGVVSILVPHDWWRPLAVAAGAASLVLMAGFFGPTKLLPMLLDAGLLYVAITTATAVAVAR